jgi:hypothetical protein
MITTLRHMLLGLMLVSLHGSLIPHFILNGRVTRKIPSRLLQ